MLIRNGIVCRDIASVQIIKSQTKYLYKFGNIIYFLYLCALFLMRNGTFMQKI